MEAYGTMCRKRGLPGVSGKDFFIFFSNKFCQFGKSSYLCSAFEEGDEPSFLLDMIEKIKILELVNSALEGTDKFLVNMKITPDNRIFVDIDGDNGVTIDDCIALSRAVESQLDREEEDFELNVGSAGADMPLKLNRQYRRHVGRELEVVMVDGERLEGTLQEAGEEEIVLVEPGNKKQAPQEHRLAYRDIKSARVAIKF